MSFSSNWRNLAEVHTKVNLKANIFKYSLVLIGKVFCLLSSFQLPEQAIPIKFLMCLSFKRFVCHITFFLTRESLRYFWWIVEVNSWLFRFGLSNFDQNKTFHLSKIRMWKSCTEHWSQNGSNSHIKWLFKYLLCESTYLI